MTVTADWVRNKILEGSVSLEHALADIDEQIKISMLNFKTPPRLYSYTWNFNYLVPSKYTGMLSEIVADLNHRGFIVEVTQEQVDHNYKVWLTISVEVVL